MWILTVVAMIAGGALAASGLIVARKPNAQEMLAKLSPFQGIIGVVLLVAGALNAINLVRAMSLMFHTPVWMIVFVVCTCIELGLGFLLAYGLLSQYVFGSSMQAIEKSRRIRARLMAYQAPLGLASIGLAVLFMICRV